jgi:hypothetical protein
MKRRLSILSAVLLLLTVLVPSSAWATSWSRITVSDWYSGKITHYFCDDLSTRNEAGQCVGASGSLVDVGNVAVYYMTAANQTDPIVKYGTTVTLPSTITLKRANGTNRTSPYFTVWDTGYAPDSMGRGWVDVLSGDIWYNNYAGSNATTIANTFEDGLYKGIYFDLSTAP